MSSKQDSSSVKSLPGIELPLENVYYAAIKGFLNADNCLAFGLSLEEERALYAQTQSGSKSQIPNFFRINVLGAINALSQLGYRVVSTTGESEITWTLMREL